MGTESLLGNHFRMNIYWGMKKSRIGQKEFSVDAAPTKESSELTMSSGLRWSFRVVLKCGNEAGLTTHWIDATPKKEISLGKAGSLQMRKMLVVGRCGH